MKIKHSLSISLILLNLILSFSCKSEDNFNKEKSKNNFDIIIYGGTPAGMAAAIQSARSGKTVAIIEPSSHIGGIMVNGLGGTDIDNHPFQNSLAVGGIALEFYRKVAQHYGRLAEFDSKLKSHIKDHSIWRFEPHVADYIIKNWLSEYSISIFLNTQLKEGNSAVKKEDTDILQIVTEGGNSFSAKVFIDASLEGDLLAASGISTTWGRESNTIYGETKNGIREKTTHAQFKVKVDPYIVPGEPSSGVIPTIQDEPFGIPGKGDKSLQAYCFRMCLTKNSSNRIPFIKPENYDRSQYEIYIRYLKAGGKLYKPSSSIPNGKTDLGAWHDLSHNLYGMNRNYPNGDYATRQRIFEEHKLFTQGLFYFLSNDEEVGKIDSKLQSAWKQWGLCKDEFKDNKGWPRQFYVRDARRMVSNYVITEHHINRNSQISVADPVAVAYWPPDLHSARRIIKDGYAYNEGFVFGGNDWLPFGISYQALVPKEEECTNILTPTCLSSSHLAYGAIRIEFTYMALGQACALAATLSIEDKISVQEIEYSKLKEKLLKYGQVIDLSMVGKP